MSFTFKQGTLETFLYGADLKLDASVGRIAEGGAEKMQAYAKGNAPWTDRTGNARKYLRGKAVRRKKAIWRIELSHSMSYGVFLEYAHEKRYAIILPTITRQSPTIMKTFNNFMATLK